MRLGMSGNMPVSERCDWASRGMYHARASACARGKPYLANAVLLTLARFTHHGILGLDTGMWRPQIFGRRIEFSSGRVA
eukprot:4028253-Pyramimonas_sp.AAC.1